MAGTYLYLLVGFPGSGKTTVAQIISESTGAVHLWADQERLELFNNPTHTEKESLKLYSQMNERTEKLLRQNKSVVFDTNFSFRKDRERLRQIAEKNKASSLIIWVTTSRSLSEKRATRQDSSHPTRVLGAMTVDDFNRIADHQQPPGNSELFIKIDGTDVDKKLLLRLIEKHHAKKS